MAQIIILGSGFAVPEEGHENTHFFIRQGQHGILVDCASNPILQLRKAGIQFDEITELVLTHFHPDHVSGVPLLLMGLWLLGRKKPLHIYGLDHTISRTESMMGLYDWKKWPNFFPVIFNRLPEAEMSLVFSDMNVRVFSSPVKHLIPTIGLRFEFLPEDKSLAYSCDTEPCEAVVRLAEKCDLLIHETAGASVGHSAPIGAGGVARQAGARKLMLIHYGQSRGEAALEEAGQMFAGPRELAVDFMTLEF
jgi:ribonuclease Z